MEQFETKAFISKPLEAYRSITTNHMDVRMTRPLAVNNTHGRRVHPPKLRRPKARPRQQTDGNQTKFWNSDLYDTLFHRIKEILN